jgi:pyroglutamyl-peptidase
MSRILVTGFGRFPGSPVNPSALVAVRLAQRRRPALAPTHRIAHVFATRYDAVDRDLSALIMRERPDIVLLLGVATRSRHLRIEERARNRVSTLFPDAGGHRPEVRTITPHAPARRNRLPFARFVAAARSAALAAARSRNAGTYLCNYAYWRALEAAHSPGGPRLVLFIHVPPIRGKAKPRGKRGAGRAHRTCPRLDDLVRAGEAIMLAMMSLARGRGPSHVGRQSFPDSVKPCAKSGRKPD